MNSTRILRQAVEQHRTPLIKFIGKRNPPKSSAPPSNSTTQPTLPPDSFASYRSKAQQHGPLGHRAAQSQSQFPPPASTSRGIPPNNSSTSPHGSLLGNIGNHSGRSLGSVAPSAGEFFDRSELPRRFWRMEWTEAEIEAVESGGASVVL